MTIEEIEELVNLEQNETLTKNDLFSILKKEASSIDIWKIMKATDFLKEDAKYMQSPYREEYIERFSKAFLTRIKDLKDDKDDYEGDVDVAKLKDFLKVLELQWEEAKSVNEQCFLKIARVIALYSTFIREEPVHPVGTSFPGGFKLRYVGGQYLCPVKQKQLDTPSALCRFCVSVQDPDVD
ncbi:MAG: DUF2115 domain-containing protein [Methanobacteriaceae archaeon]|jgi:uncharacterized protein (UPF0305 family)|nr:DUF2115 domain-containing protein [Methanobacteriaceae archaeon]